MVAVPLSWPLIMVERHGRSSFGRVGRRAGVELSATCYSIVRVKGYGRVSRVPHPPKSAKDFKIIGLYAEPKGKGFKANDLR